MRLLAFAALNLFLLLVAGCNDDLGADCAAAHGTCVIGAVQCTQTAPDSAQDCEESPPTPAGRFCCLSFPDGGQ